MTAPGCIPNFGTVSDSEVAAPPCDVAENLGASEPTAYRWVPASEHDHALVGEEWQELK
jgi:hypothetical protein